MGFHFRDLHRRPAADALLSAHLHAAAADGAAGRPFEAPRFTPYSDALSAQEDAYIAWLDARAQFRARMNQDALQMGALDRAIEKQPGAFTSFPGRCPSPPLAGVEAATSSSPSRGVAASERSSL